MGRLWRRSTYPPLQAAEDSKGLIPNPLPPFLEYIFINGANTKNKQNVSAKLKTAYSAGVLHTKKRPNGRLILWRISDQFL